jgi:hypothetical protein
MLSKIYEQLYMAYSDLNDLAAAMAAGNVLRSPNVGKAPMLTIVKPANSWPPLIQL